MVIWKYNADGSPDTSFGSSGIVTFNGAAGGTDDNDRGNSLFVDINENIFVTGYSNKPSSGYTDMVIWKYK